MNTNKNLSGKFGHTLLIYFASEVFARAIPFLLVPYYTRLLSPDEFGQLSLYLGNIVLFGALFSLSFDVICAQYYYRKGQTNRNVLIYLSQVYYALLALVGLASVFLAPSAISFSFLTSVVLSACMVSLTQLQARREVLKYAGSQVLLSILFLILVVSALEFVQDFRAVAIAQVVSYLFVFILISRFRKIQMSGYSLRRYLRYVCSFGGPLILHKSAVFLRDGAERYLILLTHSAAALGVYFAAKQLALIVLVVVTIINRAASPWIMRAIKAHGFSRSLFLSVHASIVVGVIIVYWAGELFVSAAMMGFVFGSGYEEAHRYAPQMIAGAAIYMSYTFSVNFLYYYKRVGSLSLITFLMSIVHLVLVFYFANNGDLLLVSWVALITNGLISLFVFRKAQQLVGISKV